MKSYKQLQITLLNESSDIRSLLGDDLIPDLGGRSVHDHVVVFEARNGKSTLKMDDRSKPFTWNKTKKEMNKAVVLDSFKDRADRVVIITKSGVFTINKLSSANVHEKEVVKFQPFQKGSKMSIPVLTGVEWSEKTKDDNTGKLFYTRCEHSPYRNLNYIQIQDRLGAFSTTPDFGMSVSFYPWEVYYDISSKKSGHSGMLLRKRIKDLTSK